MTIDDVTAVSELAGRIWHKHYPDIISRQQIDYMLELMYSPASLTDQITKKGHRFWLLFNDGALAGYISAELMGNGRWFIHKLYIDQAVARCGMGSILLTHLVDTLKPRELTLVVNRKNYKAINFYFRHGFFIEQLVVNDIGQGFVMDDFRMKRIL